MTGDQVAREPVGLARGGAIADADELDGVGLRQRRPPGNGRIPPVFRDMRINGVRRRHLAGRIHHRDLDPGAQTRIQPQGRQPTRRRRQQQRLEIQPEDADRLFFGGFQQTTLEFQIEPGLELDAPGLAHRLAQPVVGGAALMTDTETAGDQPATGGVGILALPRQQVEREHALIASTKERQRTVRGHPGDGLAIIEIIRELGTFLLLAVDDPGDQDAVLPEMVAQPPGQFGVLGEALHQDLARAFQRLRRIRDAFRRRDMGAGQFMRDLAGIGQNRIGQRLQSGLARNLGLGAPFGLVGQIKVFQPLLGHGPIDLGLEFGRQFALFIDALEHGCPPLGQLAQIAEPLFQQT